MIEPTQAYDSLPSLEATQNYPSSMLQATQDFTLDPTEPPLATQAYDQISKAAQDFTLEPTQAYLEPDTSSPSLSQTPNTYSDYAKTPPKKPTESNSLTSPSLSFSTSSPNPGVNNKNSSNSPLPRDEAKEQKSSQLSNPTKPKQKPNGDKKETSTTTATTLKVCKNSSESQESDENDSKGERKTKREAPSRKRKREAPSRKRKQLDKEVEVNSRKAKRTKVTRDQKYDKDLRISSNYVKGCIEEVADKLEKKRYKALCRKVSKQLVGMWSKRKPSKKKSIEKWLQRRHVKIVRLVEKYLKMDLV